MRFGEAWWNTLVFVYEGRLYSYNTLSNTTSEKCLYNGVVATTSKSKAASSVFRHRSLRCRSGFGILIKNAYMKAIEHNVSTGSITPSTVTVLYWRHCLDFQGPGTRSLGPWALLNCQEAILHLSLSLFLTLSVFLSPNLYLDVG